MVALHQVLVQLIPSCNGHGGYISVFTSSGGYNANGVTDAMLNNLQPVIYYLLPA